MSQRRAPIVVVGAGISGLALGYHLKEAGIDFLIFEAGEQAGGVIATRRCGGRILELGPQRTRLTPSLLGLVESLGLTDALITAPELPLHIYASGKLRQVPFDVRALLTTDLITWADRVRALAEPLTAGLSPYESSADFFIRKFGRRTYRRVFGPLFGDLYGSDPADMPARHALASYLNTFRVEGSLLLAILRGLRCTGRRPACSFRGGMQTMTDALARHIGDRICLSQAVDAVHRDGSNYRVVAGEHEVVTSHVVITCPAPAAGRVLANVSSDLSQRLGNLKYNPLAVVHLESDAALKGMGYQVTLDSGLATRGVTCNEALFGRPGIYTAFLGGSTHAAVPDLPDDELGALAMAEFEEVTGASAGVIAVHRTCMPAWDGSWNGLDGISLPDGISVCANWRGRAGIAGRLIEAAAMAPQLSPAA